MQMMDEVEDRRHTMKKSVHVIFAFLAVVAVTSLVALAAFGEPAAAATQPWVQAQIADAIEKFANSAEFRRAALRAVEQKPALRAVKQKHVALSSPITAPRIKCLVSSHSTFTNTIPENMAWCIDYSRISEDNPTNYWISAMLPTPRSFEIVFDRDMGDEDVQWWGVYIPTGERFSSTNILGRSWLVSDTDESRRFMCGISYSYSYITNYAYGIEVAQ